MLLSSALWICLLQAVCSSTLLNEPRRRGPNPQSLSPDNPSDTVETAKIEATVSQHDAMSAAARRLAHQRARREQRSAQHSRRQENAAKAKPKRYAAIAKDPTNKDGNEQATNFIKEKVKVSETVITIMNPEDGSQIIGWTALDIDDTAKGELEQNEFIERVYQEVPRRKRLSIPKQQTRALEKRALSWKKQVGATDSLNVLSTFPQGGPFGDYVYEAHAGGRGNGDGIYIYIIEEGIEVNVLNLDQDGNMVGPEFPNREETLYTNQCILEGTNTETDEDEPDEDLDIEGSHGTGVASSCLGAKHGVAKKATLVSVKTGPTMDQTQGLWRAYSHIVEQGRGSNSIVVTTEGPAGPSDSEKVLDPGDPEYDIDAVELKKVIQNLLEFGVPVITPAGNDRRGDDTYPPRDQVDFWPSYWEADDFPIIVVGETEDDRIRSEVSQTGTVVSTWAFTHGVDVTQKDGRASQRAGTSLAAGVVAGAIAVWDSYDEADRPWGNKQNIARVQAIRDFIRNDPNSGWAKTDKDGNIISERVLWNGATEADRDGATPQDQSEGPQNEEPKVTCKGLDTKAYSRRDEFVAHFDDFCMSVTLALQLGGSDSIEKQYNEGTITAMKFKFAWEEGAEPRTMDQCREGFRRVLDDCDQDPENVDNMDWKAGGEFKINKVTYTLEPQSSREPWVKEPSFGCFLHEFQHDDHPEGDIQVWGRGWDGGNFLTDKFKEFYPGDAWGQIHYGPDFKYETNDQDHREWTFKINPSFGASEGSAKMLEDWIHEGLNWDRIPREEIKCPLT